MSTSTPAKRPSPGALIIKFLQKRFDALRYLAALPGGFIQFDVNKEIVATQDPVFTGKIKFAPAMTATNITTAGAGTYNAAALASGLITRDPVGANRTDTTDTAANIISGLGLTANYQERICTIVNTADEAETITLAGGTNVTLKGSITCEQNTAIKIAIMRTGASAVTIRQC